jgi:hypothetical protein
MSDAIDNTQIGKEIDEIRTALRKNLGNRGQAPLSEPNSVVVPPPDSTTAEPEDPPMADRADGEIRRFTGTSNLRFEIDKFDTISQIPS